MDTVYFKRNHRAIIYGRNYELFIKPDVLQQCFIVIVICIYIVK